MKNNPGVDFSNAIIKAALINLSYDNQCESSRAEYVYDLMELSGQKKKIRKAILNGLMNEKNDDWALVQLFELAVIFVKHGDQEARKAIYKRFNKKDENAVWAGVSSIIELDGLQGLIRVADARGKMIVKDYEEWDNGFLIKDFQEQNPGINAWNELIKAGKNNKFIKAYLDAIRKNKRLNRRRTRPKCSYKTVKNSINKNAIQPLPFYGVKEISSSDIKKIASDFLKESSPERLESYLSVFKKVKYPYDYKTILNLAKKRNRKSSRICEFASTALKYFSGEDIRKFALEKIQTIRIPYDYLDLLVSNYKKGDSKLFTKIISRCKDEHEAHTIAQRIINIYEANKTPECKEPLEDIYNRINCGICRHLIVKILIKNKVLSLKIKNEIHYDSYEDTRKLAKSLSSK
jgi:hypothetical protein